MSEATEVLPAETAEKRAERFWLRTEAVLERLGDRLNPILIKEARQALKSRQFVITFALLLICGWAWSILGLGWSSEVNYTPLGAHMLCGYYLILAFPLVVLVPFGAFRSLAIEQDDRTYELLSITALSPRQIIAGKLVCAMAQMLVYLSALSPCLAFTYLLRGIDVVTIILAIGWVVLISMGMSAIGLMIGTLTSDRHWQVLLTLALIVGLLLVFWLTSVGALVLIERGMPVDRWEFWSGVAAGLTAYGSYFALAFYAAVARITFASDNRSTRLRILMATQHVLFLGWMAFFGLSSTIPLLGLFELMLVGLFLHWAGMGVLMTSESPQLSLRARRSLPQSFVGRALFTWFNPGPASGYLFAVAGAASGLAFVTLGIMFSATLIPTRPAGGGPTSVESVLAFGLLGVCYLAIYLGVGALLLRGLRRLGHTGPPLAILIHLLLILFGCGGPLLVEMSLLQSQGVTYDHVQISNFFVILRPYLFGKGLPATAPVTLTVLPIAALAVFALNLPAIVREVEYVRLAKPARVAEEDAEAEAQRHPPRMVQTSPWDQEWRQ